MKLTDRIRSITKDNEYFNSLFTDALEGDFVRFNKDAKKLGGPFNGKYGSVCIHYDKNAKAIEQKRSDMWSTRYVSLLWLWPPMQELFDKTYPDPCPWYTYETNKSDRVVYTELDIPWLPKHVVDKLVRINDVHRAYGKTVGASEAFMTKVPKGMQEEFDAMCSTNIERFMTESLQSEHSAERPYVLRVHGTDDFSWAKAFATLEEARAAYKEVEKTGFEYIDANMAFTN